MRKFLKKNSRLLLVLLILLGWRFYLLIIETVRVAIPERHGYLGFIPQANFDGVYYISISQFWYRGLDQAFFPLYPITISLFSRILMIGPAVSGIIVSLLSTLFLLITLQKLMELDNFKKEAIWASLFYLSFPSSFFLTGIYTESLFILLVILSFYLARRKSLLLSGIVGALASATRVVGIFLLPALALESYEQYKKEKNSYGNVLKYFAPLIIIPLGLLSYMVFLWYKYSDPLLFVHMQPLFGAGRSGGGLILAPQVVYRYVKILLTVPRTELRFWVAVLELSTLAICLSALYLAFKKGVRKSYLLFSLLVLILPTLSGTLSSLPRYALASFAVFIFLATIKNPFLKITLLLIGLVIEGLLASLFFQGYFVS